MPANASTEINRPSPGALELTLVLFVAVIAGSLRLAAPSHLAIEHFDEGVYASNRLADFQDPPGAYPDRHLYAPPLFPKLLEWSLALGGGRPWSPMAVNLVVGTLDKRGKFERGDRIDRTCRWLFPLAYFTLIGVMTAVAHLLY